MNALELIFLLPIAVLGIASSFHATAYLGEEPPRAKRRFWIFFLLTIASMALVVLSPSPIVFLLAWEAMGLASAGLVAFDSHEKSVRKAAWIYLVSCQAGACALMPAGVMLESPGHVLAAFVLALAGFGLKIGLPPFHVWLPEAHPAAPAPVSAIMSGAMIPLGFYGLLRFVTPLGDNPHVWDGALWMHNACGWPLLVLGALGALGGILFALPQANLKRLLAFSSVENMGVVSMGLGLFFLMAEPGTCTLDGIFSGGGLKARDCAILGALLHVVNHALLKGALFLGAGSVMRQTGILDLDRMGGLLKRMPKTGTLFILNALGLSGLPPLNGFLGELFIYAAAFSAIKSHIPGLVCAGFLAIAALSLSGALAVAAYCKAIGAAFLGEPRSAEAERATETSPAMHLPQLGLFICSLLAVPATALFSLKTGAFEILSAILASMAFAALCAALLCARRFLCPRGKTKPILPTWDCGYHNPTARMAYTATAFTQPIVGFCKAILKPRSHIVRFTGHPSSPTDAAIATETQDRTLAAFWAPLFRAVSRLFHRAHLLQNGSLHLYILIAILAVLVLLAASFL